MTPNPQTVEELMNLRKALVQELESAYALPKEDPDARPAVPALAIFTHLIRYGGVLSITRNPADTTDAHDVLLQLHEVTANGANFEEAVAAWLEAARAELNKEGV